MRRFQNHIDSALLRQRDDRIEAAFSDLAFADMRVPIFSGVERAQAVIGMDQSQLIFADHGVKFLEGRSDRLRISQVVAGSETVASIETDA